MSDFNEIINSEKPTLVDFYATWCGPCQMLSPILENVSTEVGDSAKVLKVDIEKIWILPENMVLEVYQH